MDAYPYCSALDASEGLGMLSGYRSALSPAELVDLCAFVRDQGVSAATLCRAAQCKNYQLSHWIRVGRKLHPEVKHLLHRGSIALGHCRVIAYYPLSQQEEAARQAIHKKASVRDLEMQLRGKDPRLKSIDLAYYQRLSDRLSERIGHPVEVTPDLNQKNAGVLSIRYADFEMFDAICNRLRIDLQELL